MFFLVGVIYDRAHTRDLNKLGGLNNIMPLYGAISYVIFFGSMGLPGLCGFVAEVFVVLASFNYSKVLAVLAAAAVILTAGYILWTLQRVFLGRSETWKGLPDMDLREIVVAVPLVVLTIAMGVFPNTAGSELGEPVGRARWSIRWSRRPASSMSQRSGRSRKPYPEFLDSISAPSTLPSRGVAGQRIAVSTGQFSDSRPVGLQVPGSKNGREFLEPATSGIWRMLLHARTSRCNLRPTSETPAGREDVRLPPRPGVLANPTTRIEALSRSLLFVRVHGSARLTFVPAGRHRVSRLAQGTAQDGPAVAREGSRTGMQVRSWMAAVVLVAGSTVLLGCGPVTEIRLRPGTRQVRKVRMRAEDSGQPKPERPRKRLPRPPNTQTVELNLLIAGLGREGCEVEIKPGNRSCRFQPQQPARRVAGQGEFRVP